MANDDFGSFPKPPSSTNNQDPLGTSTSPSLPPVAPLTPPEPEFEETPDVLPTFSTSTDNSTAPTIPSSPFNDFKDKDVDPLPSTSLTPPIPTTPPEPVFTPKPEPQPATIPTDLPKAPTSSLLTIILLLLAGVGVSASIFMYSQSSVLRKQLTDITKTLEQQKTVITPTPTPTIIDIPSPTPTASPTATITIAPTISVTPTATISGGKIIPLSLAPQALKIGLNHEPNAQLLLVKVENAENTDSFLLKYFFRKDLTTKKYFYVTIDSKNESEIKSSAVYVNPDNNIPSLNDQVLGNKLGIDFPEAYKIVTDLCTKDYTNITCKDLPASAQFIQAGETNIWQITLASGTDKLVYQINSKTKEVLFKPNK